MGLGWPGFGLFLALVANFSVALANLCAVVKSYVHYSSSSLGRVLASAAVRGGFHTKTNLLKILVKRCHQMAPRDTFEHSYIKKTTKVVPMFRTIA